jgi:two-component system chemotaxis sensor kinase CheA
MALSDCWHISLRFEPGALRLGTDPLRILDAFARAGAVRRAHAVLDGVPELLQLDPTSCYVGIEISFRSFGKWQGISGMALRPGIRFAKALPPFSWLSRFSSLMRALPEGPLRAQSVLEQIGALRANEITRCRALRPIGSGEYVCSAPGGAAACTQPCLPLANCRGERAASPS